MRVVGAEGLGEDVLHPGRLQHGADGAARDDAGALRGGLEKYTRAAPKCPVISHGIVVSLSGTKIRSFLACSTDLRIASGTSRALPSPTPTWPRPSPTTTRAVNENRRPPLTTLATRLMETTRSVRSSAFGSIRRFSHSRSSS